MDNQMEDSGHPMTRTPAVMEIELKPCPDCGSPCRVEIFGPSENIHIAVSLWICSNHKRFGGTCPSDLAYFDAEAWNNRTPAEPLADGEMIEKAKALREECRKGVEERGVMPSYVDACVALNHMAPKLLEHIEKLSAYNPNDRLREALEEAVAYIRWLADGDSDTIVHAGTLRAKADKLDEALSHKD